MTRRTITSLLLATALVAPVGMSTAASAEQPADTGPAAASAPATVAVARAARAGDVTRLYERAVAKVHAKKKFAQAILLEAEGNLHGTTLVKRASGVTTWRFVFDNQKTGGKFATVLLTWTADDGWGEPKGKKSPFLEDRRIHKAPVMKFKWAVGLYLAAHPEGFTTVTLRKPLMQDPTPALYIFGTQTGDFVAVNTRSGKVGPIS